MFICVKNRMTNTFFVSLHRMNNQQQRNRRYNDYPSFSRNYFGERVQKISINAGFTCPNRDGTVGRGGCTFCNNQSFNPEYCSEERSITEQIEQGIRFFDHKYKTQKYLAYFQAYTNTYEPLEKLAVKYEEALRHPKVIGLVIGTRPDCMSKELLHYFNTLQKDYYITVEYGIESTLDKTLEFINRGHSYNTSVTAVTLTAKAGIHTGAHLILGLPGETHRDILDHATRISKLPLHTIKLHQLQLIKGTRMAVQFKEHPEWFRFYSAEEYIELAIDFLELLNPEFVVERFISQSPTELLVNRMWGLKNFEFIHKLEKRLKERNTWQGRYFESD
ncbi:TIGR01212 family radical SAM protein [Saccharicrinis sp. FJH54]|uniref:TIGR01212 family radical SAM protein n=1 Tax=Saccharicrinis sp. FJH54 TaxID=3344665 RepID=UPI0035D4F7E7